MEDEIAAWLRGQAEEDLGNARRDLQRARRPGYGSQDSLCDEAAALERIARAESVLAVRDVHARLHDSIWCQTCDPGAEPYGDSEAWHPCRTVRLLARGYRHREGFKAEWAPGPDPEPEPPFDYERSRVRALEIHAATCDSPGWCNYGEPEPPELADDESLPWPERQRRAGARLDQARHCMAAVQAENRAARESG